MQIYDSRIKLLESIPKNGVIAEIGVFAGNFSEQIYKICQPKELHLIDSWSGTVFSGDENGGNPRAYNGEFLFSEVAKKFEQYNNVKIKRNLSHRALPSFQDNFFDFVYIDADHRYESCSLDLKLSFRKIKNGGYIGGHDYSINQDKVVDEKYYKNMGVRSAVDNFCQENNLQICGLGNDGYTSYLIKVDK